MSQKPSEVTKFVREGGPGSRKNHTWGFRWSFAYKLVWELKPEVQTVVWLEEGGGFSEAKFVRFTALLRTFAMAS